MQKMLRVYFSGVHDFLKEKKDVELGITPSTSINTVNVGKRQRTMRSYENLWAVRSALSSHRKETCLRCLRISWALTFFVLYDATVASRANYVRVVEARPTFLAITRGPNVFGNIWLMAIRESFLWLCQRQVPPLYSENSTCTTFSDVSAVAELLYLLFSALNGMLARTSDEKGVSLSVSMYVCLSNACIVTKRKKDLSRFLYHTKDHLASFSEKKNGWWERPLLSEILHQPAPIGAKSPILNRYSLVAPQP